MINCDVIRDLLPLYADGISSDASNRLIDEHLKSCPDCLKLWNAIILPQQLPEEEDVAYINALKQQERRRKRRSILLAGLCSLLLLIIFWAYLELQYSGEIQKTVSTDSSMILRECPIVLLTEDEINYMDEAMKLPFLRESHQAIPWAKAAPYLSRLIPENGRVGEVYGNKLTFLIDYFIDGHRVMLTYYDNDLDGVAESVNKLVSTTPTEENQWPDDYPFYYAAYDCYSSEVCYEKTEKSHNWFGFLRYLP